MNLFTELIDIIYPKKCHICMDFLDDSERKLPDICNTCFSSFPLLTHPFCSICGVPFVSKVEEDHLCEKCIRTRPFYDELRSPYLYEDKIMEAIHRLKYSGKSYLAKSMGRLLADFLTEWTGDLDGMIMIPVPLHKRKLRQRGFNQSVLLAKSISRLLNLKTDYFTLTRIRYTETQTGLTLEERRKNVKGAFEVTGNANLNGKGVILVDDVATTGNTMDECARVLKKAGCTRVFGLTLARTAAY
ncbi:MAG: ComF family protein [Desulfatiglans sp.]|jgi:ComF family protein|nr:ComF family protein [Desulfatiglans sp.]